jgi:hypothetical protein
MAALLSAVVVVGLVTALNLVLTAGMIRRIKDHEQRLSEIGTGEGEAPAAQPPVGAPVPDFTVSTTTGQQITNTELGKDGYIGFFAVGCPPCEQQLPDFVRFLHGVDGTPALIVIEAPTAEAAASYLAAADGMPVVVDTGDGLVGRFGVNRFPSMAHLSDGVVAANAHTAAHLATRVLV